MHPSQRGLLVIGSGLAFALLPVLIAARLWPLWVFFWATALLLLGLDALLLPRKKQLRHALTLPDTLYMGKPARAVLTLSGASSSQSRLRAQVKLDLSDNLLPQPPARGSISKDDFAFSVTLEPRRRGKAEIEAAWVRVAGPLGLMERTVKLPVSGAINAVPNIDGVRGAALKFWSHSDLRAGFKIERAEGDGSEFDSLKEFHQGSDQRAIDWKSSARHNKLLARHFRAERNHQIVFAVDTGRLMAEPIHGGAASGPIPRHDGSALAREGLPRLDHAIHALLTLAYVSARSGDRISLFAFDERPRCYLEPRGGILAFRAISQITGELEYTTAEANYTLGLTNLMARLTRRSLVIVLTDFVDTVSAELMIDNLQRLAGRHLVVFVALRDPLLGALTEREPRGIDDLNRAVVADALLREREVVLKRLRRRGIFCIDASPAKVGTDLVNRYLDIKRRELI